jgi:hypothetical protein
MNDHYDPKDGYFIDGKSFCDKPETLMVIIKFLMRRNFSENEANDYVLSLKREYYKKESQKQGYLF